MRPTQQLLQTVSWLLFALTSLVVTGCETKPSYLEENIKLPVYQRPSTTVAERPCNQEKRLETASWSDPIEVTVSESNVLWVGYSIGHEWAIRTGARGNAANTVD